MKNLLSKIIILHLILFFQLSISASVYAQTVNVTITQDKGMGIEAFLGSNKEQGSLVKNIFTNVITIFFSAGAIAFTIMIIWGAVDWILSGGDKEKIAGARKRITTAIVGLVILSLSFTIMVVAGQILSIDALQYGDFRIPGLGSPP